ncbi:LysR family transcriptional regulator [Pseudomonas sp. S31]|nr:LysR family transcriptional regulator [Pseudomonas sp. S31]
MKNALQHIRAFITVAQRGNFARAADDLHLSPSALTVQIRQLEGWLGSSCSNAARATWP